MPNYSLVIDATYDPLSYQEIAAPVKEAAAYHQALQDSYDKMQLASAMYAPYVKDDPVAKEMYDRYMGNLNNATDMLATRGSWGQRDMLSQARESYGVDMMPIELGFKKRESEAQIQAQGRLKGLEFSRDARTSPISYYFDHPEGGYEIADPAVLTNMVATQMKAYAEQLRSLNPEQQAIFAAQTGLPESLIATVVQYGIPAEAAINWRNYDFMRAIMRTALGSKGMTMDDNGYGVGNDTWSKDVTDRLINSMASGFAAGAGKDQVQVMQSPEWAFQADMAKQQAALAAKAAADTFGYGSPNDHSVTVDDSLTNGDELDKLINAGALLGFSWDENKKEFIAKGPSAGQMLGDYIPGLLSEMTPFRRSASVIQKEIAQKNGWYQVGNSGTYYKDKEHKSRVTQNDWITEFNNLAHDVVGTYHTLQDVSLTGYNDAFKSGVVYPVSKINKNGTYNINTDDKKTISSVLDDKDVQNVQVTTSSTATNNGLMLIASKGGKKQYYFVKTDDIQDPNIQASIRALNEASAAREQTMKTYGWDSATWYSMARTNQVVQNIQGRYENAVNALQHSIGGSNSVSATSV